ncbi:hypothetical protein TRFO_23058 [Tritrichomonas foetus]|uniref:VPS9 domain-containing protein n=1 Tax=Tritrichomonas foetus TaxID=1144522 RepID=A0A1J4KAJ6_9EUKA|nr:hypothetical protein TRFO_23058 [Tritrichomonas foetus]|eukprot:OHT08455.1 hypothetical protein TRFO_23058 [Tritrichomonas foetus]
MSKKSPRNESKTEKSPEIRLRKFQLLLKREEILNKFQEEELKKIKENIQDEYEFILMINRLLLEYHMNSINNVGLKIPQPIFDSLAMPINDPNGKAPHIQEKKEVTNYYRHAVEHFSNNLIDFSRVCVEFAQTHPEHLDRLTFSIIPGFFAFLTSEMMTDKYLMFMKHVIDHSPEVASSFGRLVFVLPDFRIFLNKITNKLAKPVKQVRSEGVRRFKKDFCELWVKYIEYCPSIVRKLLKLCPNKEGFLSNAFIRPAFQSLKLYELAPYIANVAPEISQAISDSLCEAAKTLVQEIENVKYPASLYYVRDIFDIAPEIANTFEFSYIDLKLISELVDYSHTTLRKFPVKSIPFKESFMTRDYTVYVIKYEGKHINQRIRKNTVQLSSNDALEYELRTLLTEVNVIPLGVKDNTMEGILWKQILLSGEDQRLHLEMKVHDFKKSYQRVADEGKAYSILELIDLMQKKFDERANERTEKVKSVSKFNASVVALKGIKKKLIFTVAPRSLIFQYQLVEKWNEEKSPLKSLTDAVCVKREDFANFFKNIVDDFNSWLGMKGYNNINDYAIVHNLIMSQIPLSRFMARQPLLTKMDIGIYRAMTENKDEFLKHTSEEWMEHILGNKKLIDPALNLLKAYYDAQTPIDKIQYLNRFREKVDQLVKYELTGEVGADQATPMILALICISEPRNFDSNLEYIDFFFKSFTELCPNIPLLKHNSQSNYTIVMMQASLLHIKNQFPEIDMS